MLVDPTKYKHLVLKIFIITNIFCGHRLLNKKVYESSHVVRAALTRGVRLVSDADFFVTLQVKRGFPSWMRDKKIDCESKALSNWG